VKIIPSLNILITTEFGGIAGSSYSIFYLAKGLIERGHKVIIALPYGTFLHRLTSQHGIKTESINFTLKFKWSIVKRIHEIVVNEQINLVNPQESKDRYNVIFSRMIFGWKAKIALSRRQRVADNNPIKRWLHVQYSDLIIVVSYGLQRLIVRKGYPVEHTCVIHNGLPTDEYVLEQDRLAAIRIKYNIKSEQIIIGCVARLKRQDLLVKALEYLPNHVRLLFIGISENEFSTKFPKISLHQYSGQIIFLGTIENKSDIIHHYGLMDICVLPSQMDGFGLVLIEAMAMGVPVIGSDYGGIPDVIEHGISGFIFNNNDVEQLAHHVKKILTDKELTKTLVKNGALRARHFSIEKTVSNYEKTFLSLINEESF
jgi:glycosyltransferase involved in cell wall biosynthesis